MKDRCIFCSLVDEEGGRLLEERMFVARYDNYPVSKGHALIIPRRHIESPFELSPDQGAALAGVFRKVREIVDSEYAPNGYNIGSNVGAAAGQTIPHPHIHMIPRYEGDIDNPEGGVRNIIPNLVQYP